MEQKVSVLIADDNRRFADDLKEYLRTKEEIGSVYSCYDGEEAYDMVLETTPDVVLCDIIMPKRDGLSLMKRIGQSRLAKKPMFIALSVTGSERIMDAAQNAGAEYFLLKPCKAAYPPQKQRYILKKIGKRSLLRCPRF